MNKFKLTLKRLFIGSVLCFGLEQGIAFSPSYQWFRVVDSNEKSAIFDYVYAKNFLVYTTSHCDDNPGCTAYLVGTTNESEQNGSVILNSPYCNPYEDLTLPVFVVDGNITTQSPVNYNFGDCIVSISGDPHSDEGYKISVNLINPNLLNNR